LLEVSTDLTLDSSIDETGVSHQLTPITVRAFHVNVKFVNDCVEVCMSFDIASYCDVHNVVEIVHSCSGVMLFISLL
jgi:hypothetical protein